VLRIIVRPFLAASALSIGLAAAGVAAAAEDDRWLPKAQGSRAGVEFDWWSTRETNSLTWDIVGQIQVARMLYIDVDIPWAFQDAPVYFVRDGQVMSYRDGLWVFGNPAIGLHGARTLTDKIAFFAGGTLSLSSQPFREPVSDGPTSGRDIERRLVAARSAAGMNRAYADLHRFVPFAFFIRGRAGIELRVLPVLYYRVDLTPILVLSVGSEHHPDVSFEIHNEFEARAAFGLGGGIHLQAVLLSDDINRDNNDNDVLQTAMEPYVVYEPMRWFYARAGVLVALDRALGFGFDQDKVATIRVALGGKW
jgi:hypothetical protein